ncbi:MAG: LysE family translocator [Synergistaceae bacterium]|jgi:threonine/homoserine/homoserine lactone efflux protein|nr:LysE family translocator [Synergistaceae bacterium]
MTLTFEFMWAVVTFSFGMAFTPGPNNTVAFSTGLNYGFFRTIPYGLGVATGLPLLILAVALGLGEFFRAFPQSYDYIKYAGIAYIVYLSWKIATADPRQNRSEKNVPAQASAVGNLDKPDKCPAFSDGVLFQWMNPKAWLLAVTGATTYIGQDTLSVKLAFFCGMFSFMSFASLVAWSFGGELSGRLIRSPRVFRTMNILMGILLLSSVISLL